MFEDLKDRIEVLKSKAGKIRTEEFNELLIEIGKCEEIKKLQEIEYLNDMVNDLCRRIEAIDNLLMNEDIDDTQGLIKRKGLLAEKKSLQFLLGYFTPPDITYIEETLKQYEQT